jgi:hypothetical protein
LAGVVQRAAFVKIVDDSVELFEAWNQLGSLLRRQFRGAHGPYLATRRETRRPGGPAPREADRGRRIKTSGQARPALRQKRAWGGRADKIKGGAAADALKGSGGRDKVRGNGGPDAIDGGKRNDRLRGGKGDDAITDHRGRNRISCGGGVDTVVTNQKSVVRNGCENVTRS